MNKNIKSFLKGLGSGYAKTALMILVGLWMVPFTLKFLTRSEYGIFAIAGDIILWLGLLQLGTGATLSSRAAQLIGKGDTKHLSELASTAFVLQAVAAVLTLIVGGFISLTVDDWFQGSDPIEGLTLVVFILIVGASIRVLAQVFNGLLVANKQIHIDNMLGIGLFLFQTLLTIVFLMMGMKLMALAWSALISTTLVSVMTYWRVRKHMPEIVIRPQLFSSVYVRDLLGNGIWFTIGGLAGIFIVSLDRLMVGRFVSLEAVAAFIITGKLYFIAEKVHGQIFNVMRPYFSQLHGQGNTKMLSELYHIAFSGSLLLSVFMASCVYLINQWFIGWWVGPELYLGATVSFLFALNFVMQSSVLPNRVLLASTLYKPHFHSLIRLTEGAVNLVATWVLVEIYQESGVLLGSVIASILFSSILLNVLSQQYFKSNGYCGSRLIYFSYLVILTLVALFLADSLVSVWTLFSIIWFLGVVTLFVHRGRENQQLVKIYDQFIIKPKATKEV